MKVLGVKIVLAPYPWQLTAQNDTEVDRSMIMVMKLQSLSNKKRGGDVKFSLLDSRHYSFLSYPIWILSWNILEYLGCGRPHEGETPGCGFYKVIIHDWVWLWSDKTVWIHSCFYKCCISKFNKLLGSLTETCKKLALGTVTGSLTQVKRYLGNS